MPTPSRTRTAVAKRAATGPSPARGTAVQRFTVKLERPDASDASGTMTCFRLPHAKMAAFAPRTRVPVVVTINGFSWRTTIAPYGTDFYIPVRKEVREQIKAAVGDTVTVAMQRDTAARTVEVPPDLARALTAKGAREAFDRLSLSYRKEYVQWVTEAKRPETRSRRIEGAVAKVTAGRALKGS
jgi:Bacteriocin-protection, YdeI or OmpD-Associated/Domain of unknown function (DUF1905)